VVAKRSGVDGSLPRPGGLGPKSGDGGLVVVVDGDCELCADLAAWVARRAAVPVRVEVDPALGDAVVVLIDGERHEGADGVASALQATGGKAAVFGRLLRRPGTARLAASAYRRFARRHRRVAWLWARLRLGRLLGSGTGA
jgi:predicted DCC family thiol-disulfide oxidoreductase YuxK